MQENDSDRSTTPPDRFSKHTRVRITAESLENSQKASSHKVGLGELLLTAVLRWCGGAVVLVEVPTARRFPHVMT